MNKSVLHGRQLLWSTTSVMYMYGLSAWHCALPFPYPPPAMYTCLSRFEQTPCFGMVLCITCRHSVAPLSFKKLVVPAFGWSHYLLYSGCQKRWQLEQENIEGVAHNQQQFPPFSFLVEVIDEGQNWTLFVPFPMSYKSDPVFLTVPGCDSQPLLFFIFSLIPAYRLITSGPILQFLPFFMNLELMKMQTTEEVDLHGCIALNDEY